MKKESVPGAIYACDIGSIRAGSFAWARVEPGNASPVASADIDCLVQRIAVDVKCGKSIALGFEAPLFMPVPQNSAELNRGRGGEGNRSMFAPAGAAVATLGLHEAAWILRAIYDAARALQYTLDWCTWPSREETRLLLLWEAFVSGNAHGQSHMQDAATAAVYFRNNENNLGAVNAVTAAEPLNMAHAAALWSGWAVDQGRLHNGCLVLKPNAPYMGTIDLA